LYVLLDLEWEPGIIITKYGLSFNLTRRLNITVDNKLSLVSELKESQIAKG
jgi:hypothetical protein